MNAGSFWARRKAAVEAETVADERAEAAVLAEQRDADLSEKSDAEILADLELPDPDQLGEGDDFTVFLTETIPARIRTRALRRLWLTNPVLANVDGLVDYGEDFTDASCVVENIQTAYQVGKGMTAHVEEMARQEVAEAEDLEAEGSEVADEEPADETPETIIEQPEQPVAVQPAAVAAAPLEPGMDETPTYAAPRRMRFAFEDEVATT